MFRVNYSVDNPCVRLLENIPIPDFLETLDHLVPEIVDRLLNTQKRDLPRKVDFVDEVECWKLGGLL